MKNILVVLALGAAFLGSSLAQDTPYQPNCTVTLSMTADAFMDTYTTKNNDQSEVGFDNAANYWADCKDKQNQAKLAKFPALKTRLANLSKLQNEFFSLETELAYLAAGGGTMYPHGRARFQPSIEEHMEKLIGLLTTKAGAAKSAAITSRYDKAKAKLEARLKKVQSKSNAYTDGLTPADVAARNKEWFNYAKQYALQYTNIRKSIGSGKDLASTTIMEFLAAGLWADEI